MRILIVTRNLPPLVGGMERLNWHLAAELSKAAEVRVVGPAGSAALAPDGVLVREAPLRPLWKFLLRAWVLARREALTWKPDLVLAGSGLTAPIVRGAAQTCGARTAVYVHGLDVAVRNLIYRSLWLPAIRRMDRVIANSHATAQLCRDIGVDPSRIGIVHPGVDLPADIGTPSAAFPSTLGREVRAEGSGSPEALAASSPALNPAGHSGAGPQDRSPESVSAATIRQRHNLGNGPLLLSVGRLSARKGLREFVTLALPNIIKQQPDAMLLIVGDAPNQALHAQSQTPASIQAAAVAAGVGGHLRFLGVITDYTELGTVYRACDVHVFPVREIPDDPEGFGMVAVEAAAHGLPTVAFSTGGVVDAVAEGVSGHLVPSSDYAGFAKAVVRAVAERNALRPTSTVFARQFAWSEFGRGVAQQLTLMPGASPQGQK